MPPGNGTSPEEQKKSAALTVPRVMIVGTGEHVGTSTFVMGMLVSLKRAGVSTAVAKVGPSLVKTTHHRRITGQLSHNIDPWLLSERDVVHSVGRLAAGAEFLVIEGEGGLFDRQARDGAFQELVDLADMLKTPIVLVVDAHGYQESIAAVVRGFASFRPACQIIGVVANRVANEEHNARLKRGIEQLGDVRYLGGIPCGDESVIGGSARDQAEGNFSLLTRNQLVSVGDLVNEAVDINALRQMATRAGVVELPPRVLDSKTRRCRIAVADDAAFHLTFQDNLDLIRRAGAELKAFSPLADIRLPQKIGGVYLPSGYVHLYAADLQANTAMLQALRDFANSGGVIYAEGSSLAYLCRRLSLYSGESYDMVGIVPGSANAVVEENKIVEPVYCEMTAHQENVLCGTSDKFRGMREKRWLIRLEEKLLYCFQLRDRNAIETEMQQAVTPTLEGLSPQPHVLATACTIHWASNPKLASMFVDAVSASMPALRSEAPAP